MAGRGGQNWRRNYDFMKVEKKWSHMRLGVALIKPTTSYFWFLVTFRHNRICGLAVAFKNYFLGCLPALLKIIPKTGDIGELRPNANNVIRPPPPHSSSAVQ